MKEIAINMKGRFQCLTSIASRYSRTFNFLQQFMNKIKRLNIDKLLITRALAQRVRSNELTNIIK